MTDDGFGYRSVQFVGSTKPRGWDSVPTVQDILAPNGHVKAAYPHIWERICLFCPEPRHLEQYLSSLSLQDRSSKRTGFSESVIVELADLQGANARFIPTQVRVRGAWNDIFENR